MSPLGSSKAKHTCGFSGCQHGAKSRGLCGSHARQRDRGEELRPLLTAIGKIPKKPCQIIVNGELCERPILFKDGTCQVHHKHMKDFGEYRYIKTPRPTSDILIRDAQGRKQCKKCKTWKAESEYYSGPQTSDGFQHNCKQCYIWGNVLRRFGISENRYAQMLEEQNGVCAICGFPPTEEKRLVVDHDHACCPGEGATCGRCVRGLLCNPCNSSLGFLRENRDTMRGMIEYVDKWEELF